MRLSFIFVFLLITAQAVFSIFPFMGEDASTVGKRFGFEVENNFTYFRYYDGSYHQDYIFQITVGLSDRTDWGLYVPYSKFYDGRTREGLNDAGVFLKGVYGGGATRFGYLFQMNFDTGSKDIGYGKTTANFHAILEHESYGMIYNLNLIYIKSGHVEELRDSFGVTLGVLKDLRDVLSYGIELKVLRPESGDVNTPDTHLILGCVYHMGENTDISLGVHKTLTHHPSFVDYGFLGGVLVAF